MAKKSNQLDDYTYLRQRSRRSLFGATLSMGLVLFFLGLFVSGAWLLTQGSQYVVGATPIKVFLYEPIDSVKLADWQADLLGRPYTADIQYVSKEEALTQMRERTGENILAMTEGINPLPPSVEVSLTESYLTPNQVQTIMSGLKEEAIVADVDYPLDLLADANKNVPVVLLGAILLCGLVCMIVIYLIFSAIRGAIYSQRLNIRTMQLIGATRSFIRRPFVFKGFIQGLVAGIVAGALLLLFLSVIRFILLDVVTIPTALLMPGLIVIIGGIALLGSLLGFAGSGIAVNRFLDQDLTDLMK